jgi:uncharacterized cysteine cluster protein YcgN (CxxCxxCC family)
VGQVRDRFWELPLGRLDPEEWEALCDGCGQCCLHKVEDADSGRIWPTNVACKLLDLTTARCSDYRNRRKFVPDCVRLTPRLAGELEWLPGTCAYRLRANDEPLPAWHPLISGDPDGARRAGVSVIGNAISETLAGPLEQHIQWGDDEPMEVERLEDDGDA